MRHIYKVGAKLAYSNHFVIIAGFSNYSGSTSILPQFSEIVYITHDDEIILPITKEINHSFLGELIYES